jgi:hypothetical protein
VKLGMCDPHYRRQSKGADLTAPFINRKGINAGTCSVKGCGRPAKKSGLCGSHYLRKRTGGDWNAPLSIRSGVNVGPCSVDGCDRAADAGGLCGAHYQRQSNGIDLNAPIQTRQVATGEPCSVEGCGRAVVAKGLCESHYRRQKRGVDLSAPVQEPTPRKGAAQAERQTQDPWHSAIEKFVSGRPSATTPELLEYAVAIPIALQTKPLEMRAAATLRLLGWRRTTGWDAVRGKAFKHWTPPAAREAPEVVRTP